MKLLKNIRNKLFNTSLFKSKPTIKRYLPNFDRLIDERIAILEMLLWKNHIAGIPNDVYKRLIENGFLIKETNVSKGYTWSDLSNEINQKFNKEFNYNNI